MAKTLRERQVIFREKKKQEERLRIDMWLPDDEAGKLGNLRKWRGQKSSPQVILRLINDAWSKEVKKAAHDNHAEAEFQYAIMLLKRETGDPKPETKDWFKKSYDQGYRVPAASNNIGLLAYFLGRSIDSKSPADWFRQSADLGDSCAPYNLWNLYILGAGVKHNARQAAAYLQQSAERGMSAAQRLLGVLYALGKGVPQDYEKAMEWLRRGRHEDDASCQNYLAKMLSTFPDDEYGLRDGALAVTIAEKLVQPRRSAAYLETLAAAYAEAGRFEDAINTQQELLAKLKLKKSRSSKYLYVGIDYCQEHLKSFLQKKPLRDDSLTIIWYYQE